MANRYQPSFPQFFDSTPNVYSGGKLYFYASGTSTALDTYSDEDLTPANANPNPVPLNSAGRPSSQIWLSNAAYKVVLTDSEDNVITTEDPVYTSDWSGRAKFTSGAGSPNGSVAGTAGSSGVGADAYWDTTNTILYICTTTGTTSTAVWTAVNAGSVAAVIIPPPGRLTPTSGTPITTTDTSGATAVYYTPHVGALIPIYNGSAFVPTSFSELTLRLVSAHSANAKYDVFVFNNSGAVTIVTGPAWTSATSRGTGAGTTELTTINGLLVNNVSMTGRNSSTTYSIDANVATYVGTITIAGSAGTTDDADSSRLIANYYNTVSRVYIRAYTSSDTWNRYEGLRAVRVTVKGGGGGGGGTDDVTMAAGGGGEGGRSIKTVPFGTLGGTEAVTIGAGGDGGANDGSDGSTGGTTSFGSHCSATGGEGGVGVITTTRASGGVGGVGSNGDMNFTGQGGSSADGNNPHSGQGGGEGGGHGVSANAGVDGANGGGGSGGCTTAGGAAGGDGGAGYCLVEEIYQV